MGFWLGYAAGKAAADLVRNELGDSGGRSPDEGYLLPDEVARQEACRRLNASSEIDASDVDVVVLSAELTLRGRVRDAQMKARAESLCAAVAGVTRVRNELAVG
jgi:osmotically-inducible protein OsmY